jgi:hypothetical protein
MGLTPGCPQLGGHWRVAGPTELAVCRTSANECHAPRATNAIDWTARSAPSGKAGRQCHSPGVV